MNYTICCRIVALREIKRGRGTGKPVPYICPYIIYRIKKDRQITLSVFVRLFCLQGAGRDLGEAAGILLGG
ncbi:MAG: hypothetical protein IKT90_02450, partial [Clostridia bacterium]|nr:hypothetical protein [Clostridia bacterium]